MSVLGPLVSARLEHGELRPLLEAAASGPGRPRRRKEKARALPGGCRARFGQVAHGLYQRLRGEGPAREQGGAQEICNRARVPDLLHLAARGMVLDDVRQGDQRVAPRARTIEWLDQLAGERVKAQQPPSGPWTPRSCSTRRWPWQAPPTSTRSTPSFRCEPTPLEPCSSAATARTPVALARALVAAFPAQRDTLLAAWADVVTDAQRAQL